MDWVYLVEMFHRIANRGIAKLLLAMVPVWMRSALDEVAEEVTSVTTPLGPILTNIYVTPAYPFNQAHQVVATVVKTDAPGRDPVAGRATLSTQINF